MKIDEKAEMMDYAKDMARAERELEIEHWVQISFYLTNEDPKRCVHCIDIPRTMLERWQWLLDWREAKLICNYPRGNVKRYYCYYDKRTGLETGFNSLLSCLAATKAQVTRVKRIIERYIIHETQNNLFFDPETDEQLLKAKVKLRQKYEKLEKMEKRVEEEINKRQLESQTA